MANNFTLGRIALLISAGEDVQIGRTQLDLPARSRWFCRQRAGEAGGACAVPSSRFVLLSSFHTQEEMMASEQKWTNNYTQRLNPYGKG